MVRVLNAMANNNDREFSQLRVWSDSKIHEIYQGKFDHNISALTPTYLSIVFHAKCGRLETLFKTRHGSKKLGICFCESISCLRGKDFTSPSILLWHRTNPSLTNLDRWPPTQKWTYRHQKAHLRRWLRALWCRMARGKYVRSLVHFLGKFPA